MHCWFPQLRLTVLSPAPDTGDDDRFGGRGRGFPAHRWPLDRDRTPCPPVARLRHHPDRLDLGRPGRVLFVFLAGDGIDAPSDRPLLEGGIAVVLEPEEFDPDAPGLPSDAVAYPEAVVVDWQEGDDGIHDAELANLYDPDGWLEFMGSRAEVDAQRRMAWPGYFDLSDRFKLGGAPVWTGQGPIRGLPPGLRYLGQFSGDYMFDGRPPEPDEIGATRHVYRPDPGSVPAVSLEQTEPRRRNPQAPRWYEVSVDGLGWSVPYANFALDGVGYLLQEAADPTTVHFPISR